MASRDQGSGRYLQKLIKTTAQETGIEVRSERILATVERGGYAEVPVEVTLAGPVRSRRGHSFLQARRTHPGSHRR